MKYTSLSIKISAFLIFLSSSYFKFFGPELSSTGLNSKSLTQIVGALLFISIILLNEIVRKKFSFKIDQILFLFFISSFISSMLNFNINTILNFSILFINTLCIFLIFKDNSLKNLDLLNPFFLLYISLFSFAIIAQFLLYGLDINGRNVGNFHPNTFGIQGLIILSLSFFSTNNKLLRIFFFIISFFIPSIVVSRGGLFAILFFLLFYLIFKYLVNANLSKIFNYLSLGVFFLAPIFIILIYLLFPQVREIFVYFELIDSASRGLDSGFTGRTNIWVNALELFQFKPLFGYGFNNFEYKIHSSWLKILMETGLFGFSLFFIFLLRLFLRSIYTLKNDYNEKLCVATSFVMGACSYGIIENLIFEVTQAFSLLFFFFISFIYYFLNKSGKQQLD